MISLSVVRYTEDSKEPFTVDRSEKPNCHHGWRDAHRGLTCNGHDTIVISIILEVVHQLLLTFKAHKQVSQRQQKVVIHGFQPGAGQRVQQHHRLLQGFLKVIYVGQRRAIVFLEFLHKHK